MCAWKSNGFVEFSNVTHKFHKHEVSLNNACIELLT